MEFLYVYILGFVAALAIQLVIRATYPNWRQLGGYIVFETNADYIIWVLAILWPVVLMAVIGWVIVMGFEKLCDLIVGVVQAGHFRRFMDKFPDASGGRKEK